MGTLSDWLADELFKRNWSLRDLARQSHMSLHSAQRAMADEPISNKIALKLAQTFNVPPETIFRVAGILPPRPDDDPGLQLVEYIYHHLNNEGRKDLVQFAEYLRDKSKP